MTKEDKLLRQIFGAVKVSSLKGALPCGYSEKGMGRNDEVDSLLHIPVIDEHSMGMDEDPFEDHPTYPKPWPGQEKNVFRWYELEDGTAVGWIMSEPWKFIVLKGAPDGETNTRRSDETNVRL